MRVVYFWMVVIFLAVVAGGCSKIETDQPENMSDRTLITSENMGRIMGMQWILRSMTIDGQSYELAAKKPFVRFDEDGKVSGSASVNRFFGSIRMDEQGQLTWISPLGATNMAGPDELMKQETIFLSSLPKTERIRLEKIHLYMSTTDGQAELVFCVPVK